MMGFAPPPETGPESIDEPAELRRLALRTLEGNSLSDNPFIGGYTKVEIPELETIENDGEYMSILNYGTSSSRDSAHKPKPTLSSFGMGSSLAGKRDSFGKLLLSSNSIGDQLHTLLEEEEEEEQEWEAPTVSEEPTEVEETLQLPSMPSADSEESSRPAPPQPNRHRPTNLVLRPLALTPNSLPLSRVVDSLPTPAMTPSPRLSGLKTLTLGSSPSSSVSSVSSASSAKRQSLSVSPSPRPIMPERRQSVGGFGTPPQRKSSISYKRSDSEHATHLLTPDATPTTAVPPLHAKLPLLPKSSPNASLPDLDRPLSPTEQAFLFRSHTSLLSRISELENAIAEDRSRQRSVSPLGFERSRSPVHGRFLSIASTSSMSDADSVSSQPSDELLQLVSDLKAERDELMRDVEGWRTRVSDLDKQIGMLNRRVEAERREGWVVRERLGVLEVEKKRVREDLERERLENRRLDKALLTEETARKYAEDERDALSQSLQLEQERREAAEREHERLESELAQLRERADRLEIDLQAAVATPKIPVSMHRFDDSDSQISATSTTDVEEYIPLGMRSLKLNSVSEEPEDHDLPQSIRSESECGEDSDNDELAHYEDDDILDEEMMFDEDHTSSSFGDMGHTSSHLLRLDLSVVATAPAPVTPSHTRTGSMERGWSFPQSRKAVPAEREPPKVDRFFECLDALDNEAESDTELCDTATAKQFWRGAVMSMEGEDDDELPPFVLPPQPSTSKKVWKDVEAAKLEVVAEEEEEEDFFNSNSLLTPKASKMRIPAFTPQVGIPILKVPPSPKRAKPAFPSSVPASSTKDSYTGLASSPSSSSITPPANRASITGSAAAVPSMIPRLSISSKITTSSTNLSPPTVTSPPPPSPSRIPTLMSPLKTRKTSATMPVFIPQPKVAVMSRSSLPPIPPPARMLTRFPVTSQQTSVTTQGLTAKLSQLWAGGISNNNTAVPIAARAYVSKEQQLERLRERLGGERRMEVDSVGCASCRGTTIDM